MKKLLIGLLVLGSFGAYAQDYAEIQRCTLTLKEGRKHSERVSEVKLRDYTEKLYSHTFAVQTKKGDIEIKIEQDGSDSSLYYKLTAIGEDKVLEYMGLRAAPRISMTPGPMYNDGEEYFLTNAKRFSLSCQITRF